MTENNNTGQRRRRRRRSSIGQIESIVVEVLSWLPIKSLVRFKSVCKSWYALISDPYFVDLHRQRSKAEPRILILPIHYFRGQREMAFYTYQPNSRTARFLFGTELREPQKSNIPPPRHCNGLILLSTQHSQVFVCNPSSREVITLPKLPLPFPRLGGETIGFSLFPPPYDGKSLGLGFVQSTNEFKVTTCYYERRTRKLPFYVYTLGTESWRRTARDPPYPIEVSSVASVNGDVYWKIDNRMHRSRPKAILSFSLKDEQFKVIPCPPPFLLDHKCSFCLAELEGALCFLEYSHHWRKPGGLWMFKDNCPDPSQAWTKRITIMVPPQFSLVSPTVWPISLHHGKLLMNINGYLFYLDIEKESWESASASLSRIDYHNPEKGTNLAYWKMPTTSYFHVINHVESMVPIPRCPLQ